MIKELDRWMLVVLDGEAMAHACLHCFISTEHLNAVCMYQYVTIEIVLPFLQRLRALTPPPPRMQ